MSMYRQFKADENLERNGVKLDYDSFQVTITRAGASNKNFAKVLEAKTKPVRRAMQIGSLSDEKAMQILYEVFAETVILNWETKNKDGAFLQGIEDENGAIIPFNKENVVTTFKNLPELFLQIKEEAEKISLFQRQEIKEEAGN